jgi:peptidyl-prolyl cis-trans isomerase A (cyclophilin A)
MGENKSLDPGRRWGYTVFGMITDGTDVIDAISNVDTGVDEMTGLPDVPVEQVVIKKVSILPEL